MCIMDNGYCLWDESIMFSLKLSNVTMCNLDLYFEVYIVPSLLLHLGEKYKVSNLY